MANENQNPQNQNPDAESPNVQSDADAGDILEQLKAESASTANLYKLELKMFKTVTNVDKTLTKQHKVVNQAKKSLDSINIAMKTLIQDTSAMKTTVSSIDTSILRILTILESANLNNVLSGSAFGSNSSGSSNPGLQSLERKLRDEQRRLDQAQLEREQGDTSDENAELIEDLQDSIKALTDTLQDAYRILAESIGDYRGYATVEESFEEQVSNLLESFSIGQVTQNDLSAQLKELRLGLAEHRIVLDEAGRAWKDDGKFSFAKEAKDIKESIERRFDALKDALEDQYNHVKPDGTQMTPEEFESAMADLMSQRATELAHAEGLFGHVQGIEPMTEVGESLDKLLDKFSSGRTFDPKTGMNTTASSIVETAGSIGGELVSSEVGAAIGTAIGGPVGTVVGTVVGDLIGSKIEQAASIIGDRLDYLMNHAKKTRDEILKAGLEKIRSDVKDMATYSIEVYESATKEVYASWDKNLAQLTATQGYTKEALNSLQDAVAQRLQAEGYGNTIDAGQYLDQLANTLSANLGGTLAEAFAAQNMILQKAVPEVDLSASAAQFAAIYANANRETGTGEQTMISAMNEIAGAAKALESVTEGNNQFLKETSSLLSKATEVVQIAGGNADQVSKLTTQMMASEAAISSVAPQLSGFTSELVNVLMNNNDANSVALRAIMHDINNEIGVSATSFMQSFMSDTQDTLSTAFAAIQRFIDQNENDASRQEFLHAMESVFGVNGSKLAQIDFGSVADMIARVDTSINMAALTNAENLVKSGETTTAEEQLVANTANQLLATNAISATLDNKLMRKLENNELQMERLVYSAQATQSVDLAENTLNFFTRISDLIMSVIDPLGIFDMVETSINATTSSIFDAQRYMTTAALSQIGSTVADSSAGQANAFANTIGGASAVLLAAETKSTDAMVAAVEHSGVSPTFQNMISSYTEYAKDTQAAIAQSSAESNIVSYAAMEQQARQSSEYQQKQDAAKEQEARYEEEKAAAREQQRIMQEQESIRNIENHDNIASLRESFDSSDVSEYLQPILDESKTHTDQISTLQERVQELVRLVSTVLEYNMVASPEFASTISYDERSRIMDNGYISPGVSFVK